MTIFISVYLNPSIEAFDLSYFDFGATMNFLALDTRMMGTTPFFFDFSLGGMKKCSGIVSCSDFFLLRSVV